MRNPLSIQAADELAVQITKMCLNVDACNDGYRLQGLVFNQQPYDFERQIRQISVRSRMLDAFAYLGGDAAVALAPSSADVAKLLGFKNIFELANPLQSKVGGVPGVLAVKSEFNSLTGLASSDSLGIYANGGQLWDFAGQSMRGLNSVAASSIGASNMKVNQFTVTGDSTLQKVQTQSLSANKLKLPSAAEGALCNTNEQSLAIAIDGTSHLLVCSSASTWILYKS
jgi:hypothetical protein